MMGYIINVSDYIISDSYADPKKLSPFGDFEEASCRVVNWPSERAT